MNDMRHGMFLVVRQLFVEICFQVVDVHVPSRETAARRDMKVTNHLVHPDVTFDTASFSALGVEFVAVTLALALFNVFALAKCP